MNQNKIPSISSSAELEVGERISRGPGCEAGCGFSVEGRLVCACPTHPGVKHLTDLTSDRPRCQGLLGMDRMSFKFSVIVHMI